MSSICLSDELEERKIGIDVIWIKVLKLMISVSDRVENICEKGEIAGYQHFLLFPQCFQRAFYSGSLKVRIL